MGDSKPQGGAASAQMQIRSLLARISPFDRQLLLVLSLLVLASFLLLLKQGEGARVLVQSGDRTLFVADLSRDQQVELAGPLGTTVLQIEDGAAQVISSPCQQKICIGMGAIRHPGELLACVPNRLVIRILGRGTQQEQGYDVISH